VAPPIVTFERRDPRELPLWGLLLLVVLSLGVHVGFFLWLSVTRAIPAPAPRPVEMEIIAAKPRPIVEEKKPEPPKPIEKPKPVKVARNLPPPPKDPPPPPKVVTPPPPNQPPPPKAAPPPPINIGLSLDSTTKAGGFAAPVGNTLYGKAADRAADPNASKPYAAPPAGPKFVPSYKVTEPPSVVSEVKAVYPEAARKEGLETQVLMQIAIDTDGHVTTARVLQSAGHGFDEAALEAIRKFRFKPARLGDEAVATEITYKVTFLLN
jgi:protein TonB